MGQREEGGSPRGWGLERGAARLQEEQRRPGRLPYLGRDVQHDPDPQHHLLGPGELLRWCRGKDEPRR